MKKLAYGIVGLLVVLIGAAVALPFLLPTEKIKEELVLAVNDSTGRILSLDGDFGLSVFPVLGLNATNVSFSNAPSSNNPNMATIDRLVVELNLIPLLSGQVSVDKFILKNPAVFLEIDKKGKKNWEFEVQETSTETKTEDTSSDSGSGGADDLGINDLNLGDVQIIGGSFTYVDGPAGVEHKITEANLSLDLRGLDQPFKTDGSAVWKGEKISLKTEIGALRAVLENKPTTVSASINSSKVTFEFGGDITTVTPLKLGGSTNLDIPSLKDLVAWAAEPMEAKEGIFGPVSIKGTVSVDDTRYAFSQAELGFDAIKGTGDFAADIAGKIPTLKGNLDLPLLDVNPYLPAGAQGTSDDKAATAAPATKAEKWDTQPIDFSGLKLVNADFKLSVGQILIQKMKIGKSVLNTKLKNGVLDLGLDELALYDGKGVGKVHIDASNKVTKISKNFTLEGLQLKPFLTDAADFERLEGTGLIEVAITTTGNSQMDMMSALNGAGRILFTDGAVSGFNLAAMARNAASAFTGGGGEQKTDFAELSGTYTIVNGLLTNSDLKLLNPFIEVSGNGTVNIPPKTLDYRLEPKVTASTKGQGAGGASGITVPIVISGGWDDPKFAPDLAGALGNIADPKALKESLGTIDKDQIKEKLKGDNLKDTLKGGIGGLFGKPK
jgi:AsmA protein